MINALLLTLTGKGRAVLSASVPSTATGLCNVGFGDSCTNTIQVTCTPVGGSEQYAFNWEFVTNPDNFSMVNDQQQTVSVSKSSFGVGDPSYNCVIRCLVTDNITSDQVYSNECNVTSTHISEF